MDNIKENIEMQRKRLGAKIFLFGIDDPRVLKESEILDKTITRYEKNKKVNMDILNKLDISKFNLAEQAIKLVEEHHEFQVSAVREDKENAIEEFWDLIQAAIGVMDKLNISDKEIKQGLTKHNKKLLDRGWDFESSCSWY